MELISFTGETTMSALENTNTKEYDSLDFGVVKLDKEGIVEAYNTYQANQADENQEEVLGKNFYKDVAPCTNNFMVAGKLSEDSGEVDEFLEYIFTYKAKPTKVKLRLLVNSDNDSRYLLIKGSK